MHAEEMNTERLCFRQGKMEDLYVYINKDENPSTKNTRHVDVNVNTQKKNQNHQNNSNEMKNVMFQKGILCHKLASDGSALVDMCEKDEKL